MKISEVAQVFVIGTDYDGTELERGFSQVSPPCRQLLSGGAGVAVVIERQGISQTARVAFGRALRRARLAADLTAEQLGEMVNYSQPMVSGWEKGSENPPSPVTVFELERALGLKPGALSAHLGYLPIEASEYDEVEKAVLASAILTDEEKNALLAVYEMYRRPRRRLI